MKKPCAGTGLEARRVGIASPPERGYTASAYLARRASDCSAALSWVAESASDAAYRDVARLRLAGMQFDAKAYDDALKQLGAEFTPAMAGMASDLRGDVLQAKGQTPEAIAAYQQAWTQLADVADYRRLVQAKLNALGVDPQALAPESKK